MALARKLAYNVVFNAFAKIGSTFLALVAIGFITRSLGKEGFGDYATVLTFFALFNSLADLGLQTVTAREISRADADEKKIIGNVMALRLSISLLLLAITPVALFFSSYSPELKWGIIIASAAFVFSSVSMVLNGIFQKHLAMDRVATIELIGKVIQISVIILVITHYGGFLWNADRSASQPLPPEAFIGITSSLLAYMAFNALAIFWLSRRYVKFSLHFDRNYWKEFLGHSLPVGVMAIVTFAYFKMDTLLLYSLRHSSAEVGIYNAAYKVIENLVFFPAMVAGLVLPLLSRFIFSEREKFEIIANKTFKVFYVLIVPLVIGGFFLAPQIIHIVGGDGFAESADVLRILIFALAFIFLGYFFNTILVVANLQKKLMIALSVAAVFNISLNFFLIPRYSYIGTSISSVATEMLVAAMSAFLVARFVGYRPEMKHFDKVLISGLFMGAFLWNFSSLPLVILLVGSIVLYLGMLWLLKGIEKEELMSLARESKTTNVDPSLEKEVLS